MPFTRLQELKTEIEGLLNQLRSLHEQGLVISKKFPDLYKEHIQGIWEEQGLRLAQLKTESEQRWAVLTAQVDALDPYAVGGIELRVIADEKEELTKIVRDGKGKQLGAPGYRFTPELEITVSAFVNRVEAIRNDLESAKNAITQQAEAAKQRLSGEEYKLQRLHEESLRVLGAEHDQQLQQIDSEFAEKKGGLELGRDKALREAAEAFERSVSEAKSALVRAHRLLEAEQSRELATLSEKKEAEIQAIRIRRSELTERLQGLRRVGLLLPLHQRPWTDADWQPFTPPGTYDDNSLRIGRNLINTPAGKVEFPLLIPFLGESHLWIDIDQNDRDKFMGYVSSLVLRLYASSPPGGLSVLLFDPSELGTRFRDFSSTLPRELFRMTNDEHEFEDELKKLTRSVIDKRPPEVGTRSSTRGTKAEHGPTRHLILINDFPRRMDRRLLDRLEEIGTAGHLTGLHILGLIRRDEAGKGLDPNPTLHGTYVAVQGDRITFTRSSAKARLSSAQITGGGKQRPPGGDIVMDIPYGRGFPLQVLEAISRQYEFPVDVPRSFLEHLPRASEIGLGSSAETIILPVGVSVPNASSVVSLEFDSEQSVHAFILGSTGRGKSTLLTEVITGLALRYSPDELELVLLDDKEGVEFERWRILPHVTILKIGRDTDFALAAVEYLEKEMKRRGDIFRDRRVRSLSEFRWRFPGERMPRILMIWDNAYQAFQNEQELSERVVSLLTSLAKDGRYTGIHLTLTTQDLQGIGANLQSFIRQCDIRIDFNDGDDLLDLGSSYRRGEKLEKKGEAWCKGLRAADLKSPLHVRFFDLPPADKSSLDVLVEGAVTKYPPAKPRILMAGELADPARHRDLIHASLSASANNEVTAWLGDPVSIADPVRVMLTDELAENLLLVGDPELLSPLLGLQAEFLSELRNDPRIKLHLFTSGGLTPAAREVLGRIQAFSDAEPRRLEDFPQSYVDCVKDSDNSRKQVFLVWNIESLLGLKRIAQSEAEFEETSVWDELTEFVQAGPQKGVHIMAWTPSTVGLSELFSNKELHELFASRVAAGLDQDGMNEVAYDNPFRDLGEKRALLFQRGERPTLFIPYGPSKPINNGATAEADGDREGAA
jgi:hypothetical protein